VSALVTGSDTYEVILDELATGFSSRVAVVTVLPVVLGDGTRLFERRLARPLQLTRARPLDNGQVELHYELLAPTA
jgi:hypothetical protein